MVATLLHMSYDDEAFRRSGDYFHLTLGRNTRSTRAAR